MYCLIEFIIIVNKTVILQGKMSRNKIEQLYKNNTNLLTIYT